MEAFNSSPMVPKHPVNRLPEAFEGLLKTLVPKTDQQFLP